MMCVRVVFMYVLMASKMRLTTTSLLFVGRLLHLPVPPSWFMSLSGVQLAKKCIVVSTCCFAWLKVAPVRGAEDGCNKAYFVLRM